MKFLKRSFSTLLAVSLGIGTFLTTTFAYSDVPSTHPYYQAITYVQKEGLMTGFEDGDFHPDNTITRGMVATIIYRMMGSPVPLVPVPGFDDVPDWSFYKIPSSFMLATGIMTGNEHQNGVNTFDGEDPVRRGDLSLIFYRLVQNNVYYDEGESDPFIYDARTVFEDAPYTHYAYTALDWAYANGLLEGNGRYIYPMEPGNRAITANFLYQLYQALGLDSGNNGSNGNNSGSTGSDFNNPAGSTAPDYLAPVTESNVLALLDAYDPDGAWILRNSNASNPFMSWMDTSSPILDNVGTAVHEQAHVLSFMNHSFYTEDYYVGNGQMISVSHGQMFDTAEINSILDPTLNAMSFRYDTYVSPNAEALMDSRQNGIYGLFNEFMAYCWGSNTRLLTWPVYLSYLDQVHANSYRLFSYSGVEYSEFMYWMLSYLWYASQHYPSVYQEIVNNQAFRQAFTLVDNKFRDVLQKQKTLDKLSTRDDAMVAAYTAAINAPNLQQMYNTLRI